jgi:hypothetical protein
MTAPQILTARVVAEVGLDGRDGLSAPAETPLKTLVKIHVGPFRAHVTFLHCGVWPGQGPLETALSR